MDGSNVTYGTTFMIGIVASLSTCMAVVGGLVLSVSATFANENNKVRPQLMFHFSRLLTFFILGGVIGVLGSLFTLNTTSNFILSLIVGLIMLLLGFKLLGIFSSVKRFLPTLPSFFGDFVKRIPKFNSTFAPVIIGVATFFLPCGFTQSMQIYTLTTGTFLQGGLTMLAFALGTLPVLALISFSSYNISKSPKSGVFFKTAGLIVILFALFNLINSLVVIGLVSPVFNF